MEWGVVAKRGGDVMGCDGMCCDDVWVWSW